MNADVVDAVADTQTHPDQVLSRLIKMCCSGAIENFSKEAVAEPRRVEKELARRISKLVNEQRRKERVQASFQNFHCRRHTLALSLPHTHTRALTKRKKRCGNAQPRV